MPDSFLGLPLHPLIVHATVVIVPLAALSVLLAAVWPRFRRWAGWLPFGLSAIGVVLAPLSTSSGETLQAAFGGGNDAIRRHAELGEGLLVFVAILAVIALAYRLLSSRAVFGYRAGALTVNLVGVLAVAAALAALVDVALIGHSGAQAAWDGIVQ